MNKIDNKKQEQEEYLYHNTLMLLKNYRDVVWSIEASVAQIEMKFEIEFDSKLDEFLEMSYAAGANLAGTEIEEQMRTVEKNRKMLKIIERSIDLLKKKHGNGKLYYKIIHYSYLSEKEFDSVEEIIDTLSAEGFCVSTKTFFRRKKEAVSCLSNLLWGFTTQEFRDTLTKFIPENSITMEADE